MSEMPDLFHGDAIIEEITDDEVFIIVSSECFSNYVYLCVLRTFLNQNLIHSNLKRIKRFPH